MENPIRRMLLRAVLLGLASGVVITIAGLVLGWKTYAQFSDGYFWVGAVMISIGLVSVLGAQDARTVSGLEYSVSAVHLDSAERFKIWASDMLRSYHVMAFLGTAGVLLLALAGLTILIGRA